MLCSWLGCLDSGPSGCTERDVMLDHSFARVTGCTRMARLYVVRLASKLRDNKCSSTPGRVGATETQPTMKAAKGRAPKNAAEEFSLLVFGLAPGSRRPWSLKSGYVVSLLRTRAIDSAQSRELCRELTQGKLCRSFFTLAKCHLQSFSAAMSSHVSAS